MLAVERGNIEIFNRLLELGEDPLAHDWVRAVRMPSVLVICL